MPNPVEFRGPAAAGKDQRAVVVAAVVVLAIALGLLRPWDALLSNPAPVTPAPLVAGSPTMAATAEASAAPTADPATLPFGVLPPSAATWSSLHWEALARTHPIASASIVASGPAGYLLVARGDDGTTPVWSSADGSTWSPVPFGMPDSVWPGTVVVGAAAGRDRTVMVAGLRTAGTCEPPAPCPPLLAGLDIWSSPDGHRWSPTHLDAIQTDAGGAPVGVAASGTTIVVLATASPPRAALSRVVVSSGGAPWRTLPDATLPATFEATDLGVLRGRFIATGRLAGSTGDTYAAVATSVDGTAWDVAALPAAPGVAVGQPPAVAWQVAAGSEAAVVTGALGGIGGDLWWRSADGRSWSLVDGFPPLGAQGCPPDTTACAPVADGFVVGDGTHLVAGGFADAEQAVSLWTSSDGIRWRRLGAPEGGPTGRLGGIMLLPGGVAVSADGAPWYGAASP
jgi:hypothetical protein